MTPQTDTLDHQCTILSHEDLPGVEIKLAYVTPALASYFLSLNADNQRTLREDAVNRYGGDMQDGAWLFAGDPIRFDKKNRLIDGQHRLSAIVESGTSQLLIVISGLEVGVIAAIDAGAKRNYGDYLKIEHDIPQPNHMASLVRSLWYWHNGNYGIRGVGRVPNPVAVNATPTTQMLEAVRLKVQDELSIDLVAALRFGNTARTAMPALSATTWSLGWVLLTQYDPYQRDAFFVELLKEPKVPDAEYPVNVLKNRLMREAPGTLDRPQQLHFLLTSFNAWSDSVPKSILRKAEPVRWNTLAMPKVMDQG